MKTILTRSKKKVQVSDEDYDYLNQFLWSVNDKKQVYYIRCRDGEITERFMSRLIAERMDSFLIENRNDYKILYKDGDSFNNQRENLQIIKIGKRLSI